MGTCGTVTSGGDNRGANTARDEPDDAVTVKKAMTFTPVNRIGEPCACCARDRRLRAVRGVRVDDPTDKLTVYYCDSCIGHLAKAKEHP
jgi:hypothetical protein